jgi:hypothetical protein
LALRQAHQVASTRYYGAEGVFAAINSADKASITNFDVIGETPDYSVCSATIVCVSVAPCSSSKTIFTGK